MHVRFFIYQEKQLTFMNRGDTGLRSPRIKHQIYLLDSKIGDNGSGQTMAKENLHELQLEFWWVEAGQLLLRVRLARNKSGHDCG